MSDMRTSCILSSSPLCMTVVSLSDNGSLAEDMCDVLMIEFLLLSVTDQSCVWQQAAVMGTGPRHADLQPLNTHYSTLKECRMCSVLWSVCACMCV